MVGRALACPAVRWRMLAAGLIVLALGSLAVSLASRGELRTKEFGWTTYTPLTRETLDAGFEQANRDFDAYDEMGWHDARMWLGLAIGLGAAGAAVGAFSLRRDPRTER